MVHGPAQRTRRHLHRTSSRSRAGRAPVIEPLEGRVLLSLLGLVPQVPLVIYDSTGSLAYNPNASDVLTVTAAPLQFLLPPNPVRNIVLPRGLQLRVRLDGAGNLLGGVTGDDLTITGDIDVNGDGSIDYSGVLLTGEVLQFGWQDTFPGPVSGTDKFDFRFLPTGGALRSLFDGKDIAITLSSERSNFAGDFSVAFAGGAKGNVGSVAPLLGSLSGYVYLDLDNDGVRGPGESGIPGVSVTLTGSNIDGLAVNLPATTDGNGFYSFTGLRASDANGYTVTETQPLGYLDGLDAKGGAVILGSNTTDVISGIALGAGAAAVDNTFGERVIETIPPAEILGFVYLDANNNGVFDAGETPISGVTVTLTGSDDQGEITPISATTGADGAYRFADLRPGAYTVTQTQPLGYLDGLDARGGLVIPGSDATDVIAGIELAGGEIASDNNFGERLAATPVAPGQAATIGFWQNKNGQKLIRSLNGGENSSELGTWLATQFSNLYGPTAGLNNLLGKSNTYVANYFLTLFNVKGQKSEAQLLAVALACYVTNSSLAGDAAVKYGFQVSDLGLGGATYNVGANGAAFGVPNEANLTVMQILQAVNGQASGGVLYATDPNRMVLRNMANSVLDGINNAGDIG